MNIRFLYKLTLALVLATTNLHAQHFNLNSNNLNVGDTFITRSIFFEHAKSKLKTESKLLLDSLADFMIHNKSYVFEIGVHTDYVNPEYSFRLTKTRAKTIYDYLISMGVEKNNLKYVGYGETKPIVPNKNADGSWNEKNRYLNRRTEIKIISKIE